MLTIFRALLNGLLLRCPRCHRGRMFESAFKMRQQCPICGLLFERSSGEVTGGMVINLVVTITIVMACSLIFGLYSAIPPLTLIGVLAIFTIVFPIIFYRTSRGLWAGLLYLTAANDEPD
jgi:uncharacterized protein (DUF983 family)